MVVLPSILAENEERSREKIARLPLSVTMIHLDILDGKFVPNRIWVDPRTFQSALPKRMRYEAHFMVADPLAFCHVWGNGNSDPRLVRMIFHVEAVDDLTELVTCVRASEKEFWLAWNPETPFSKITETLSSVDGILVMANTPGFSGKKADIVGTVERIKRIRRERARMPISVDIGVSAETAPIFRGAGATMLIAGSYLFTEDGKLIEEKIKLLQNL